MDFMNIPPKWDEQGTEPSTELQENGFTAGYKPPAAYFNYLFHRITECLKELQTKTKEEVENLQDGKQEKIQGLTETNYPGTAARATTADTATKAMQDGDGRVIKDTYEEKIQILPVSKGGTGKDNLRDAANDIVNAMPTGTTAPADNDYFVAQKTNGGTTNTSYYRKPMTALWNYIKGKIETVLGLSATSYGGNATTATSATSAATATSATKATQDGSGNNIANTYAKKSIYGDSSINLGTKADSTTGNRSIVVGYNSVAEGRSAAALGSEVQSLANCAFTSGYKTRATFYAATAIGNQTTAIGDSSYSQGYSTNTAPTDITVDTVDDDIIAQWGNARFSIAKGAYSHVEGWDNVALGFCSHVSGHENVAFGYQYVIGSYNDYNIEKDSTKFTIGNGNETTRSNAFRVTRNGSVYAKSAYNATGADYAEFAEWADGNPNNEDRRGYFVTYDESKPNMIRKANAGDYILGIVSGNPCIIGNSDEAWLGRYVFDEFGSIVYKEKEIEVNHTNPETGDVVTIKENVIDYELNPDYDETKQYIHRKDRKEWSAVGWIGVLSVRDDGTCVPGEYCTVSDGGIATAAERGADTYRVLERVTENIVKVAMK